MANRENLDRLEKEIYYNMGKLDAGIKHLQRLEEEMEEINNNIENLENG